MFLPLSSPTPGPRGQGLRSRGDLKGATLSPSPGQPPGTQVPESIGWPRAQGPSLVLRGKWPSEGGRRGLGRSFQHPCCTRELSGGWRT